MAAVVEAAVEEGAVAAAAADGWVASATSGLSAASEILPGVAWCYQVFYQDYLGVSSLHVSHGPFTCATVKYHAT